MFAGNTRTGFGAGVLHNYSAADVALSEEHFELITSSIFEDYGGGNFRLKAPTEAGANLGAPYDQDMFGVRRGADGTWDRGAFEFGIGQGQTPSSPQGLRTVLD
jgi:hypothetical protein